MKKIIFWTMLAMAFLFAICTGEDVVTTLVDLLKDKPIYVDVLVSDIKTRAGYDKDNLPTKFYLTIDQDGTEYDYNNVVMKYEEGKWVAYESDAAGAATVNLLWANSKGNITVKAATFSLSAASTTLTAQTDQSTADGIKASDHLYYYSNAATPSENGTISIPFDHIMSKLEIKVTLRDQNEDSETTPITSATLFGSAASAIYSPAGATPWSAPSDASDIMPCPSESYNISEFIATYDAILIPQNIAENTFGVTVAIGDKSYTWTFANAVTFEGGKKYILNLTLGKNELTLNALSVSDLNKETVTRLIAEPVRPYVTFTAASKKVFNMEFDSFTLGANEYFEYSVGDGEWKRFTRTVENIRFGGTLGSLRLRGKSSKGTAHDNKLYYSRIEFFSKKSPVDCSGDIRTLIDYENYDDVSTANARFCNLFCGNPQLRTTPELPATTLAKSCYEHMFSGCSALTEAPELPATTLAKSCYESMFSCCSALTEAPELPATTLAESCYEHMFSGCSALTEAPELPATTLAKSCYESMFSCCSALTEAPELPATTLAESCYKSMFLLCGALTEAPKLPAKTLAKSCYANMFNSCTALRSVTMLATDVSADGSLINWLGNAGTLVLWPEVSILTLAKTSVRANIENSIPDIWKKNIKYRNN